MHGKNYDLVCNGWELASGSIRIHRTELQRKILKILGYDDEKIEKLFGHMLEAFDFGAPPHGGFGAGIDRTVMVLAGEENIREVMAFPKNQSAMDLTFGAPSPVTEEQLKELHISLTRRVAGGNLKVTKEKVENSQAFLTIEMEPAEMEDGMEHGYQHLVSKGQYTRFPQGQSPARGRREVPGKGRDCSKKPSTT